MMGLRDSTDNDHRPHPGSAAARLGNRTAGLKEASGAGGRYPSALYYQLSSTPIPLVWIHSEEL